MATVRTPLLVLDTTLRVRSANRAFYDLFHVTSAETEGRLLSAVGIGEWDIPALRRRLAEVLAQHQAFEDFEVDHDFPTIGPKTMLLNAREIPSAAPDTTLLCWPSRISLCASRPSRCWRRAGRPRTARPGAHRPPGAAADITRAANEAPSSAEALRYAVDRICASTGWPVGHAYLAMAAGAVRGANTHLASGRS